MPGRKSSWFEYSVTRAFTIPYLTPVLLSIGTIWIAFVTTVSFVVVAYETVSVSATPAEFNSTSTFWYEKVFPSWEWFPNSRECQDSFIKIQDCALLSQPSF